MAPKNTQASHHLVHISMPGHVVCTVSNDFPVFMVALVALRTWHTSL